jgi:hypothetical protein
MATRPGSYDGQHGQLERLAELQSDFIAIVTGAGMDEVLIRVRINQVLGCFGRSRGRLWMEPPVLLPEGDADRTCEGLFGRAGSKRIVREWEVVPIAHERDSISPDAGSRTGRISRNDAFP